MKATDPTVTAWDSLPTPVDEREFTPWAEGKWLAWNGQSPEVEVVLFAASLVMMMRPEVVIETGVGQGYMTRTIVEMLGEDQRLIAYESNDHWRISLWSLGFWLENSVCCELSGLPTPGPEMISQADLCVFDSDWDVRFSEVEKWHQYARPGTVALIHDTSDRPNTIHQSLREHIAALGLVGTFLKNPRGCFMAVHP